MGYNEISPMGNLYDGFITSWNDNLSAPTTRNARVPGIKLTKMAVSGVWPLFVVPIVFLIISTELFLASKKRVRLATYRAELLQFSISHDCQAGNSLPSLRSRDSGNQESRIEEAWKNPDTGVLNYYYEW